MLRHQRIAHCHTGRTFLVDLILSHVNFPYKWVALALWFLVCRPLREYKPESAAVSQPVATHSLRVVLARVAADPTSTNTDLDPRPVAAGKKRKDQCSRTSQPSRPASDLKPSHCPMEGEVRHLRHQIRCYEVKMMAFWRRISHLDHADSGWRHWL